jgi:hypothetical protein
MVPCVHKSEDLVAEWLPPLQGSEVPSLVVILGCSFTRVHFKRSMCSPSLSASAKGYLDGKEDGSIELAASS